MEERLSWGDVPRQPKLQSSRSGSGWGEAQRGTVFIGVQPSQVPGFVTRGRRAPVPARWEHRAAQGTVIA